MVRLHLKKKINEEAEPSPLHLTHEEKENQSNNVLEGSSHGAAGFSNASVDNMTTDISNMNIADKGMNNLEASCIAKPEFHDNITI